MQFLTGNQLVEYEKLSREMTAGIVKIGEQRYSYHPSHTGKGCLGVCPSCLNRFDPGAHYVGRHQKNCSTQNQTVFVVGPNVIKQTFGGNSALLNTVIAKARQAYLTYKSTSRI